MVSRLFSCWGYLWVTFLLGIICTNLGQMQQYKINYNHINFDEALAACDPNDLTTFATKKEATEILNLISASNKLGQKHLNFWVGLRKAKHNCVLDTLPLKGFKWTADGSQRSEVHQWRVMPVGTCTTARCAILSVDFNSSTVIDWGLVSVSCNKRHPFICKSTERPTAGRHKVLPEETKTSATTLPPKTATPTPRLITPEPGKAQHQPTNQPKPGPEPGLKSCLVTHMQGARALMPDPENSSRLKVECWSGVQVELHCSGQPATWQMNRSSVDFSTVCLACRNGFKRDKSGKCVDINECISDNALCRHHCLNTEGSYKCICYDQHGDHHNEDSSVCTDMTSLNLTNRPHLQSNQSKAAPTTSGGHISTTDRDGSLSNILIVVVIAVLVLVALVAIIAVIVKCCLMRRMKKRVMKKVEKMTLKHKDVAREDSFERTNEKEVI
ncbi:C-type lectin domain family 14 member A [Thalassophryne amazonica]|uniref:C-type lectin domain family 14 member A n=1 Tax=Thalassophryne amazonica TaxID=390379 RepID=UPI001471BE02|nr:C-type lectin domain family 14 member A [Thalassophryne amazonica]XP_034051234.1 C-type lectin domain family 14 member A [Thalassophryne amazonica]